MMKIYRFQMVLAFALLCLCSWTSVMGQASEEIAVDCMLEEDDACESLADAEMK